MTKEKIIEISNLSKSFGESEVLKDISFDVYRGELIGYIGPNGAGKSTTTKILLNLIDDYSGTVKIFGEDIKDNYQYKSKIGYIPETEILIEQLTAIEYLTFVLEMNEMDYESNEVKIHKLAELLELDINKFDDRLSTYSKGMKQKVAIIAALINDPQILFMDEPFNGMDTNSVMLMRDVLKLLKDSGMTIFYSSHIMEIVEKLSSRIIILDKGRLVADAPIEELRADENISLENFYIEKTGQSNKMGDAVKFVQLIKGDVTNEYE
ncbi:MAG: ABC transporter ATP-binding protein [Tissierellia bacterium]|nr:ABC transporter ATP-binding protein [Tissierellia bacterium]